MYNGGCTTDYRTPSFFVAAYLNSLPPLPLLPHKLVSHIQIPIKVKAGGFVVKVGAGLALVKQLQGFHGLDIQPFGYLYRDGADAVAHDNLLYDR